VQTSNGLPCDMPAEYAAALKRHGVTNALRWNGDHKNKERYGEKGTDYVRVTCKEPGRRGKNNTSETRMGLRVAVQCLFRDVGLFLPDDMEVHFLTNNHANWWPENWELRSRYENKHFADAVLALHAGINWRETK
jgi:hypothetical protein